MRPFITSIWMIRTRTTYHLHDRREGVSAVFTGVFALLASLVELVTTSVASVGMTGAGGTDELPDVWEAVSAVFAIVVCHRL